uniref:Uncharacterized protein n=1 Tax=Anguilla anguilla TaxID=7936 RepID=A0A0E9VLG7_ANGAN
MAVFRQGLSEHIQDELATREEVDSLEALIEMALRLDNRLRERPLAQRLYNRCFVPF